LKGGEKMKKNKGFTLVELLVVIAIIGLLSTLAFVSLNNARAKARDAKRVSDVRQIQSALELFYNNQPTPSYPISAAAGENIAGIQLLISGDDMGTTLPETPGNPETDCGDPDTYWYTSTDDTNVTWEGTDPVHYSLGYCLGGATGGIIAGSHRATEAGIAAGL